MIERSVCCGGGAGRVAGVQEAHGFTDFGSLERPSITMNKNNKATKMPSTAVPGRWDGTKEEDTLCLPSSYLQLLLICVMVSGMGALWSPSRIARGMAARAYHICDEVLPYVVGECKIMHDALKHLIL
jgi:hypothetical protein